MCRSSSNAAVDRVEQPLDGTELKEKCHKLVLQKAIATRSEAFPSSHRHFRIWYHHVKPRINVAKDKVTRKELLMHLRHGLVQIYQ